MFILLVILYMLGLIVTYSMLFAYAQRQFPITAKDYYILDMVISFIYSIAWPFVLLSLPIQGYSFKKHGFKLW